MKQFDESLEQIATALKNGELAIFIGAGLSASVGFPTANELLQLLFQKDPNREHLNPKVESLASAADWCSANKDVAWLRDSMLEIIREEEQRFFRTRKVSPTHKLIGELPCVEIITTNWDTLLEHHGVKKTLHMSDPPPSHDSPNTTEVIHLHNDRKGENLITSTRELITYETERPEWASYIRDILDEKLILFVGHGLADDWLRRFILEGSMKRPAFAVDPYPDEVKKVVWRDLNVLYLEDENGPMSTETFFGHLAEKTGIEFLKSSDHDEDLLVDFSDLIRKYNNATATAGNVHSEIGSNQLYESTYYHFVKRTVSLGTRIFIYGNPSSGKSTLAFQIASHHRGIVKYLDMGMILDVKKTIKEIEKLSRRDLLILDDMHRSPSNSIQLLKDLGDDSVCNIVGIFRKQFIEHPFISKIFNGPNWLGVETKAVDEIHELIAYRLKARKLEASQDEVASFVELFQDDLTVVCTALDSWDAGENISYSLVNDTVLKRLHNMDNFFESKGLKQSGRLLLILSSFWQYEISVPYSFLVSPTKWNIPFQTVEALEKNGDIIRRRFDVNGDEQSYHFFPAIHANAAKLLMTALETADKHKSKYVDLDWFKGHSLSKISSAIIYHSVRIGSFSIDSYHEHFVYQGLRDSYVELVEMLIPLYSNDKVKEVEMLINLGSTYRRLGSVEFPRALKCFKKARILIRHKKIMNMKPLRTQLDILYGKLLYEESYILFLKGDYLGAAQGFHKSYEMDFRFRHRRDFAMMSRHLEAVSEFFYGKKKLGIKICDECVEWFRNQDLKSTTQWRFFGACLSWKARMICQKDPKEALCLLDHVEDIQTKSRTDFVPNGTKGIAYYYNKEPIRAIHYLKIESEFRHEKYPEGEAEYLYFLGLAYEKISDSVAAKASYRKACTCDSAMGNSVWKSKAAKKLEELSPK